MKVLSVLDGLKSRFGSNWPNIPIVLKLGVTGQLNLDT